MMSTLRHTLPVAIFITGIFAAVGPSYGNIKYTKLEKRPCVTCHTTIKGKELNAIGKCYKSKQTLRGCEPSGK